jgi:hypothetical protein
VQRVTAVLVVLVAFGTWPAAGLADGDPASDVLAFTSVFTPYVPPASAASQHALAQAVGAAQVANYPLRVAVIGAPSDLGSIPEFYGKPQQYATFLDQELVYTYKGPLLVVMAQGYGLAGQPLPKPVRDAVAALPRPASDDSTVLVTAAAHAVDAIRQAAAPASGAAATTAGGHGASSATPVAVAVVIGAGLLVVAVGIVIRRRRAANG